MTWSDKPIPPETCSCGAEWFPITKSLAPAERDRQAFREAHAACRLTWQRCPVCDGRGSVPPDFYTQLGYAICTSREQCRTCTGPGVMARPGSGGVQPEGVEEATTA